MALQLNVFKPPPAKSFCSAVQCVSLSLLPCHQHVRLQKLNLHKRSALKIGGGSSRSHVGRKFGTKACGTTNGLELLLEAISRIPSDLDPTKLRIKEKEVAKDMEKKESVEESVDEIVTGFLKLCRKLALLTEGCGSLVGFLRGLASELENAEGRMNEKQILKDNEKKELADEIVTDALTLVENLKLLTETMPDPKQEETGLEKFIGKVVRVPMDNELEYKGLVISVDPVNFTLFCYLSRLHIVEMSTNISVGNTLEVLQKSE